MNKPKKVNAVDSSENVTMRLPVDTREAVKRLAKKDRRSFSNYVALLLESHAREAGELVSVK